MLTAFNAGDPAACTVGAIVCILAWPQPADEAAHTAGLLATYQRVLASDADRLVVVAARATERTRIRIARLLADAGLRLTGVVVDERGCTFLEARPTHRNTGVNKP